MKVLRRAVDYMKGLFKSSQQKAVQEKEEAEKRMALLREETQIIKDTSEIETVPSVLEGAGVVRGVHVPRYLLNRKMRRFLKRMGWDMPKSRVTTPEMWRFINKIMNAEGTIESKRALFRQVLGY